MLLMHDILLALVWLVFVFVFHTFYFLSMNQQDDMRDLRIYSVELTATLYCSRSNSGYLEFDIAGALSDNCCFTRELVNAD